MSALRVGILTAGGFAPCLSAAVGGLIQRYHDISPETELIAYRHGYTGLLKGDHVELPRELFKKAHGLLEFGGSPIGNSRVKLTNNDDCRRRGLIAEGQTALERAAEQLVADRIDVLHTVGGDDTSTTAADLAQYLQEQGHQMRVVGLPKTIDNDIIPVQLSLGAWTAAEHSAQYATHIMAENSVSPRMLIVHEVMGRHCGWLTAAAADRYIKWHSQQQWLPGLGLDPRRWGIHAVWIPEAELNIEAEIERLRAVMDDVGCVNVFVAEGAGLTDIVHLLEQSGEDVARDAFGHIRLDDIQPGEWFAKRLKKGLSAEKVLVQKSGYYARSAPAGGRDLMLIQSMVDTAVTVALQGGAGLIGHDTGHDGRLRAIEFDRVAGGRALDIDATWVQQIPVHTGQPEFKAAPTNTH